MSRNKADFRDIKTLDESLNGNEIEAQTENLGSSDSDALNRMHSFRRVSLPINQTHWAEADIDTRFEAGDQVLWDKIGSAMKTVNQSSFVLNRIRRIINMISGQQRQNRRTLVSSPAQKSDEETSSQFSKLLIWITQKESLNPLFSDVYRDILITGISFIELAMDYTEDPISGDIKFHKCDYNSMIIDPYFKKKDLSDCNGILRRSYLTRSECKLLQPAKADLIDKMQYASKSDSYFSGMVEAQDLNRSRLFAYDEFYYRAYRQKKVLYDEETGEVTEWRGIDPGGLERYLELYPQVTLSETTVPTVNLTVTINDEVMYDGLNPQGLDVYPFVPFFVDYNPNIKDYSLRIQGKVRGLRDPQFLYNRRKILEMNSLEAQTEPGWIFRPDYLIDKRSPYRPQGNIAVKKDTPPLDDVIKRSTTPSWDPNVTSVGDAMGDEMEINAGLSKEMFGTDTKDIAGVTVAYRHRSALAGLQGTLDNLDEAMGYVGDRIISLMQINFTAGKVQRIIEEQPTQQFYDRAFGKYDCVVEDGLNTTTQMQMQFANLLNLKDVGVTVPGEMLIDNAPLQNKKELREAVARAEQQAAEVEQRKLQGDMEEQQARVRLADSRAYADESRGHKDISEIQENEADTAEKYSAAQKNRALGELSIAKTLKELDDIDISQMEKLLNMAMMMKAEEQADRQQGAQRSAADQGASKALQSKPPSTGGVSQSISQGKTVSNLGGVKTGIGNISR